MKGKKLLLIDDEEDIRTVAQMSLQAVGGFEVLLAGNGEEGLRIAADEKPDAILLDMMMPGVDGPATFRRLQEEDGCSRIPVIFLTAKAQRAEVQRLKELGPIGILTKPFDPMKLPDQVRALMESQAASP